MNKERLEILAATIEKLPHHVYYGDVGEPFTAFNMNAWNCGTAACIGGWAQHLWVPEASPESIIDDVVAEALGLNYQTAIQLFFPGGNTLNYRTVTPAKAAAVIRNLIATGNVDWSVA